MRASFRLKCVTTYHRGPQVCGSGKREAGGRQCQRLPCFHHLENQDNNYQHDGEDRREVDTENYTFGARNWWTACNCIGENFLQERQNF